MSAKLFNEPKTSERPQPKQASKRIDDLILDAELEAQDEISRKIRSERFKMVILVLLGVGLFYVLNTGIDNKNISVPSFMAEDSQVATAPQITADPPVAPLPAAEPDRKPIPFPLANTAPDSQNSAPPQPGTPSDDNLSPLENEVLAMLQNSMKGSNNKTLPPAPLAETPTPPSAPATPELVGKVPVAPAIQASPTPAAPAVAPVAPIQKPRPAVTAKAAEPKAAPTQLTADQSRFFIQVGAYSIKSNADRVIKRLMTGGYSPLVQTRTSRSSMYVVYIGGFADSESPKNMMSALRAKGLNPQLKKNDNGSYSIILGKEKSKTQASSLKQKLTRMGIFTSMKQMKINSRMFIVRVEGFNSTTNARSNQKRIEGMGYPGTIIRKKS